MAHARGTRSGGSPRSGVTRSQRRSASLRNHRPGPLALQEGSFAARAAGCKRNHSRDGRSAAPRSYSILHRDAHRPFERPSSDHGGSSAITTGANDAQETKIVDTKKEKRM